MIKAKEDINMSTVFAQNPTDLERFAPAEVIAAAPDFLAQAFGNAIQNSTQHPLASAVDLPTIASAYAQANSSPSNRVDKHSAVARGVSTGGFARLIGDAANPFVLRSYEAAAEQHAFAAVLGLPNFHDKSVFSFDVGHSLPFVADGGRVSRCAAFSQSASHGVARVSTYSKIFQIDSDSILTNDLASLVALFRSVANIGAQTEARLLVGAIDGAPRLSDGPVFDETNTHAQTLNAESLGLAVHMLRNQGAPGEPLNIAPRHLVVATDLEILARKLIREADLRGSIGVQPLAGLSSGRWALLADPAIMPSISLYHLAGARSPLALRVNRNFASDGLDVKATLHTGVGFVGRFGIVRCGADLA